MAEDALKGEDIVVAGEGMAEDVSLLLEKSRGRSPISHKHITLGNKIPAQLFAQPLHKLILQTNGVGVDRLVFRVIAVCFATE